MAAFIGHLVLAKNVVTSDGTEHPGFVNKVNSDGSVNVTIFEDGGSYLWFGNIQYFDTQAAAAGIGVICCYPPP